MRPASLVSVDDLQVRHAPALVAHVLGHDPEALGLDLARTPVAGDRAVLAGVAARTPVEERRKHEAFPVKGGADEQHAPADGVEPDEIGATAKAVHAHFALLPPRVPIERRTTVGLDAVRLDDVLAGVEE